MYDSKLLVHVNWVFLTQALLGLHSSCWQELWSPLKVQPEEGDLLQNSLMCLLIDLDLVPRGSHHRAASKSLQAIQKRSREYIRSFSRRKTSPFYNLTLEPHSVLWKWAPYLNYLLKVGVFKCSVPGDGNH